MTAITTTENTAVQNTDPRHATSLSLAMDPASMDKMLRVAEIMAAGRATVPKHLQGSVADCLAVTMQAMTWGMSPFVVAQKTHLVNGALGYEAQLVNAVVSASGAIEGTFHYEYEGKSPRLSCRVGAVLRGQREITWGVWLCEAEVTTKNSPLWKTNPAQQLGYLQLKNWARLYAPGPILGVYSVDELEAIPAKNMGAADVVPPQAPSADLIEQAEQAAAKGAAAYQTFWKDAGKDKRKLLAGEHERLKALAAEADAARTVDQAPSADALMQRLEAAQTLDQLMEAADLIGEVADPAQREALSQRYLALAEKFGG